MKVILPCLQLNNETKENTQDVTKHRRRSDAVLQSRGVKRVQGLPWNVCFWSSASQQQQQQKNRFSPISCFAPAPAVRLLIDSCCWSVCKECWDKWAWERTNQRRGFDASLTATPLNICWPWASATPKGWSFLWFFFFLIDFLFLMHNIKED